MTTSKPAGRLTRAQMAWRAAQEISHGSYVNLGIGIPEMAARFVPAGRFVTYQSENGILGFGETPPEGQEDFDLVNAGKRPVTAVPGTCYFDHATSFAMIRGGHIDLAIMGAFQVAQNGDLANWKAGDDAVPAVGGAMDLVCGAKRVHILMSHCTNTGEPKLVERCSYPLTGAAVVSKIFTDLAVIDVIEGRFVVREIVPGLTFDELQAVTAARLFVEAEPLPLKTPQLN